LSAVITTLACAMHWEESMMFVVPVVAVGAWSWWSSRRSGKRGGRRGPTAAR
jgi:hypothetical protein